MRSPLWIHPADLKACLSSVSALGLLPGFCTVFQMALFLHCGSGSGRFADTGELCGNLQGLPSKLDIPSRQWDVEDGRFDWLPQSKNKEFQIILIKSDVPKGVAHIQNPETA